MKSEMVAELVTQLQETSDPLCVDRVAEQLERAAVEEQRLLSTASEIVRLLAAGLPSPTPIGAEASWRVLAVIAKASYWIAISDFRVLFPVREALISDVVPHALDLVSGQQDGAAVWHAVDVLLNVLSYIESDPRSFKKALRKFSKRGPDEARYLAEIFPR